MDQNKAKVNWGTQKKIEIWTLALTRIKTNPEQVRVLKGGLKALQSGLQWIE